MSVSCLPASGRVPCADCHRGEPYSFDRLRTEDGSWRITNNPLAWGNIEPEILILGFSKGPTQVGALAAQPHNAIAYRGGRTNLAKILHHVGLLPAAEARLVDQAIADPNGRFHFASLVRCTVERFDSRKHAWTGTGGGMLDKFVATDFGRFVTHSCATRFLADLPARTRLIVMLGMGSRLNYVKACRSLYRLVRPGDWRDVSEVAYSDGKVTVVHTEHFQSQGALIPNWLSGDRHERGRFGDLARAACRLALG